MALVDFNQGKHLVIKICSESKTNQSVKLCMTLTFSGLNVMPKTNKVKPGLFHGRGWCGRIRLSTPHVSVHCWGYDGTALMTHSYTCSAFVCFLIGGEHSTRNARSIDFPMKALTWGEAGACAYVYRARVVTDRRLHIGHRDIVSGRGIGAPKNSVHQLCEGRG